MSLEVLRVGISQKASVRYGVFLVKYEQNEKFPKGDGSYVSSRF